jgi:hypothetical protein
MIPITIIAILAFATIIYLAAENDKLSREVKQKKNYKDYPVVPHEPNKPF